jgi:hypothetical protein
LRVVSVTENVVPRALVVGGLETASPKRSGLVTVTEPEEATTQLLPSFVSTTVFRSSAQASRT